jgi:cation diffusion facilitator CzcD-associated flavoprotein CzcO
MTQESLQFLEDQVRADLDVLRHPTEQWIAPRTHPSGKHVYDVVIVGAGQSGLAISSALLRDRVDNIVVFDRRRQGLEGPWNTTARMRTLRTPKHLPGMELGIPSLAPRAWFIARYGHEAWERLDKISKEDWQEYLLWCRRVLGLPVENDTDVTSIAWEDGLFRMALTRPTGAKDDVLARYVVLATGVDGSGDWHVPEFIATALPRSRYAHAGEAIDFSLLKGKRVAVLGAGASAFDNASTALEAGAAEAVVCLRRKEIQRINPQHWMGKAGFLRHFADLDDDWKWRFMRHMFNYNIPAPQDAYNRLSRLAGARIRQNAGWRAVRLVKSTDGDEIEIDTTSGETIRADFLILAVGFVIDFRLRPELGRFHDNIALWRDRYAPPKGEEDPVISSYPYLGADFELIEKVPGAAPYLSRIRNFSYGSFVSMGLSGAAISGLKYSVRRLASGVTRSLFLEEAPALYQSFTSYAVPELVGPVPFETPAAANAAE